MALVPGEINQGEDGQLIIDQTSMARAIEKAFLDNWGKAMGNEIDKPKPNKQMQLLFVAVAEGVIKHLIDNPLSITITLKNNNNNSRTYNNSTLTIKP